MASEGDPYDQFINFNYRKILLEIIKEEDNMEVCSSIPVDRQQLIKNFFQKVNDLFPLQPGTTFDSIVVQFYQLKKEINNLHPIWKFMTADIRYVANILSLLDAVDIGPEENIPDVMRNVTIFQRLYHTTRI